jgi:hypothetical protein
MDFLFLETIICGEAYLMPRSSTIRLETGRESMTFTIIIFILTSMKVTMILNHPFVPKYSAVTLGKLYRTRPS